MVPDSSNHLSQAAIIALSFFLAICLLCFLAFTYNILRQKIASNAKNDRSLRHFSYDTFESQTAAPSILLDEQFIQPPGSSCHSTTNLSLIHAIHSEGLQIPISSLRRHSAHKAFQIFKKTSETSFLYRPVNSCIQFSHSDIDCLTLHLSFNYVHTVELLKIVVDKVSGLPKGDLSPKIYILQFRIMPRSPTSAYLSKPLVTLQQQGTQNSITCLNTLWVWRGWKERHLRPCCLQGPGRTLWTVNAGDLQLEQSLIALLMARAKKWIWLNSRGSTKS